MAKFKNHGFGFICISISGSFQGPEILNSAIFESGSAILSNGMLPAKLILEINSK